LLEKLKIMDIADIARISADKVLSILTKPKHGILPEKEDWNEYNQWLYIAAHS
jgi:hypothetical protein